MNHPRLIKHKAIDFTKWDECIDNSSQKNIYAYSWYLNTVSPGWDALVWENDVSYLAVIPLPVTKKIFWHFLIQPFYTQQLGLFSLRSEQGSDKARLQYFNQFIRQRFHSIAYNINTENVSSIDLAALDIIKKTNYVLNLNSDYATIQNNYDPNHIRTIKKAINKGVEIRFEGNLEKLICMFRENQAPYIKEFKDKHYDLIRKVYHVTEPDCHNLILEAYVDNNLVASAFFKLHKNTFYYLFSASTKEGRKNGASILILDTLIKTYAGKNYELNFEGGSIKSIASFFSQFGPKAVYYGYIRSERLPFLFMLFKKLKHVYSNR